MKYLDLVLKNCYNRERYMKLLIIIVNIKISNKDIKNLMLRNVFWIFRLGVLFHQKSYNNTHTFHSKANLSWTITFHEKKVNCSFFWSKVTIVSIVFWNFIFGYKVIWWSYWLMIK